MKKILRFLLVLFIILIAPPVNPMHLYIRTRVAPVFDLPDTSAKKVHVLVQNEKVDVLDEDTGWCKVFFGVGDGWVKKDVLTTNPYTPPTNNTKISSIEVRKRASNFTSSAAAGRGLANENIRDRSNVKFSDYDFKTIIWLETCFAFDPEYLILWFDKELDSE